MEHSAKQRVITDDSVYKNRYLILGIILIGLFMSILDGTMVSIALPTMTTYFHVNLAESQWVVNGYLIAMTGLFIFFARISEYFGKTKLFLAGWALFTLSSLACGLAPGLSELVLFRLAQGIGASMVSGVAGATIYLAFPPAERGKAMGFFGVVFGLGALIGPGLGGFLVDHLGWQYIFLINVPIGVVLLALAVKYLKVPEATVKKMEMDWVGAAALVTAIGSLMLFCGEVSKSLAVTTFTAAYAAVFLLSAFAFLFWEARCAKPLLDLSIFSNKLFVLPIVCNLFLYVGISMANTLQPFYFELVMGYTPSQVGLLSMVVPLFMMFSAPIGGLLYDRRHPRLMAGAGLATCALGFALIAYGVATVNLLLILGAFVLRGIGSGFFASPNSVETMGALPREKAAVASSVTSTVTYMAIMLGVALSAILLTGCLSLSNYAGPVYLAGSYLLSGSIGAIMLISAALCLAAAAVSLVRNYRVRRPEPMEKPMIAPERA